MPGYRLAYRPGLRWEGRSRSRVARLDQVLKLTPGRLTMACLR